MWEPAKIWMGARMRRNEVRFRQGYCGLLCRC